eukprot:gene26896-33545_t
MVDLINFVLMAAGSKEYWIARDVDLEALGPPELDELLKNMMLAMTESSDSLKYPLTEKTNKNGTGFRARFQNFFELLTEKIRALPVNSQRKSLNASEILHTVVDQLISLSSMALLNVRDAVTEAALSIGQNLLRGCGDLKTQISVAQRQISAEEAASKSSASLKSNPKYISCVKLRDTSSVEMEGLSALCNTLFNSVLVHRLKDFNEEVRVVAVRHLQAFLRFDLKAPLRIEFLKYVGFSCSDFSAVVRLEAVKLVWTLLQDDALAGYLQQFIEHFMERFIEICAGDLDHAVALQMVQAFRSMQRNGLLDTVAEEKLDLVDRIVFDSSSSEHVREEALGFLMDHTEGFDNVGLGAGADTTTDDDEDEEEEMSTSSSARKKRASSGKKTSSGGDGGVRALAKRQRTALQLETFTEFAMHHLEEEDFWEAALLAEACLLIPDYAVLFDWSTMISLLLRESDELISNALRPQQATILLHLFITSATHVRVQHEKGDEKNSVAQHWESLNVNLQRSLASLLVRFRDDDEQLAILARLLDCCDFSGMQSTMNSGGKAAANSCAKSLKGLLKILTDVFLVSGDGTVLTRVATSLRGWRNELQDAALTTLVSTSLAEIAQTCWQAVEDASAQLKSDLKERPSGGGRRKSSSSTPVEVLETMRSLSAAVGRFKVVTKHFDVGSLGKDLVVDDVVDMLLNICGRLQDIARSGAADAESEELMQSSVSCATNCAYSLVDMLLWTYHELVEFGKVAQTAAEKAGRKRKGGGGREAQDRKKRKSSASAGGEQSSDEVDSDERGDESEGGAFSADHEEQAVLIADKLAALRDRLVAVLSAWMQGSVTDSQDDDANLNFIERHLSLVAFRLIFDLRSYFPVRHSAYCYVDEQLAFRPSKEVLLLQKTVFDSEGRRIALLMGGEDDLALSNQILEQLLFPFSRTLLFDFENLNKHQSSSVVKYLLDGSEVVQEGVRVVLKRLKDLDVVKYLEVQLVALKAVFEDQVLRQMQARLVAEQQDDEDSFDLLHYRQLEENAYARAETLARKLSMTMGVGKLKEALVVRTMVNLLKAGLTYCLQTSGDFKVWHLGFASLLTYYVRFMPADALAEVGVHLTGKLQEYPQILAELNGGDADEELDEFVLRDVEKLRDFQNALHGGSKPKMTRRFAAVKAVGDNDSVSSRNVSPAPRVAPKETSRNARGKNNSSVHQQRVAPPTAQGRRAASIPRPVSNDTEDEEEDEEQGDEMDVEEEEEEERFVRPLNIAYGLDIEDDEEEGEEDIVQSAVEEEEDDFLQAHNKKKGSAKKGGKNLKASQPSSQRSSQPSSQRSSRSTRSLAV